MATSKEYTISRKVSDTEEEMIQIPYGALTDKPDLSVYQTKTDNALETTDKTVVGAINEVNSTATANKTDIANIKNGTSSAGVARKVQWVFHLSKWNGQFTDTKNYDGSKAMRLGFNTAKDFELGENASGLGNGYVVELKNTGVNEGTYNNVTVDSRGRVTAGESKDYALKSDVPAKVTSVDGLLGGTISGNLQTTGNMQVDQNLTVSGNLTVNGTTTTVDSTTLQVKDKLIEVAHGNTTKLTTPAGLVAPKYDGTNSGALVFDGDGTAYVGDVTLDSAGNIDVSKSGLQPLATRTGLVGGNLVQYDSTAQTLKDSGKKIGDLATTSQVNAKYTKPSAGIPKTDLASDVQTSLGKADSALQSHQDISGKANLAGGNSWTGNQQFNQGGYWFATDTNHPFVVELENGDTLVKVNQNGVAFDSVGLGSMPLLLNGNAGTSGQVLTSQGASKTPIWEDAPQPDISGKQDKLTAGANISISGNTISATDTGMVDVDVVGGGNAITGAAYSARTRLLTLVKGATYATTSQIPDVSGKANLSGGNIFQGKQEFENIMLTSEISSVGPHRVFRNSDDMLAFIENPSNAYQYTSQAVSAFFANTDANNRTVIVDGRIDNKKSGTVYKLTLPQKEGTLAVTSDIPTFSLSGTTLTITL